MDGVNSLRWPTVRRLLVMAGVSTALNGMVWLSIRVVWWRLMSSRRSGRRISRPELLDFGIDLLDSPAGYSCMTAKMRNSDRRVNAKSHQKWLKRI